ncbi:cystathionine beta-lyase PatB [Peptoclostridium acidaminophilum DSM 3953]|uniref:cysteine-S-conjugate beta-lyase n=1 Tax=Peptoclostridium acidaminophilum DSM 3953 TaxID=1286171 RepID=W8TIL4_PEPAC|nr:PatB family C-S lyase [Peptoclostridium acidaminophilum]AHM56052.1 cystathionine beta-lyase PatB [Peptoclostridium acidaminophilum DSM 3953]
MNYNFDEIVERRGTNAMNTDGFREYIFHAPPTMKFPYADDEFIRMWVADMEFATPPAVVQAIKDRADKRIFGYTKVFDPEYYEAFSSWTQDRYAWTFPKEHLVTSNGIIPALFELIGHICKPDEKILILTPSYAYFKYAADFNSIETVCSTLLENDGYYTMDFDDIERKAKDEKVTLCVYCNPHNPSGRVWSEEELRKVGQICLDNGLWIISDEIHCDLLRTGLTHTPLAKLFPETDRIITCMAPSKTFNMAGLMFSNVIIPNDELRATWKQRHYPFENPLSIAAAQAAYLHGEEWLNQLKAYLDGNFEFTRQYLEEHLPKAVFKIPESTYLAWININAYVSKDVDLPLYFANNAGVLLEGGNMFVADSDGYIRLNLACPSSVLEEGLRRICELLNK